MIAAEIRPQALPFFLPVAGGELFCLYHQPASNSTVRGALLYVPPFGDEMAKCRRMAALQARAFAASGYAVLLLDLWGCGDSSGDFVQARWERWQQDLAAGWLWLAQHASAPRFLWAVRLGALLAYDFAQARAHDVAGALFWQAELDGAAYMHNLQRMQRLSVMLANQHNAQDAALGDEIGGYQLAPALCSAIAEARCTSAPCYPLCSIEFVPERQAPTPVDPSSQLLAAWRDDGARVELLRIQGLPFWSANEIMAIPQALTDSVQAVQRMQQ